MFEDGATTVSEDVVQMEKIQQSINESNRRVIDECSNQVGEVDSILHVIKSISEQTIKCRGRSRKLANTVKALSL